MLNIMKIPYMYVHLGSRRPIFRYFTCAEKIYKSEHKISIQHIFQYVKYRIGVFSDSPCS